MKLYMYRKEFIPSNVPYPARNVPFELKSDASSSRTLSHLRGQERDYRNRNPSPLSTQSINDPTIVKTKPFGRTNIDKTYIYIYIYNFSLGCSIWITDQGIIQHIIAKFPLVQPIPPIQIFYIVRILICIIIDIIIFLDQHILYI